MADDQRKTGNADRKRTMSTKAMDCRDWSKRFDVTPDELKKAIAFVGPMADAVQEYLGK